MAKNKRKKQDKHAKLKLASIPVLLVVLAYVLWSQSAGRDSSELANDNPVSKPKPPTARAARALNRESSEGAKDLSDSQIDWPEPNLEFLSAVNPFEAYEQPERVDESKLVSTEKAEESEPEIDVVGLLAAVESEIMMQPSRFIFQSQQKKVAVIGSKEYQVGDEIRDRIFIEAIEGQKLILKYIGPETGEYQ
ncbi:MAG: hypothetical protein AAF483_03935 [Planctomycetota bacterium]